MCPPAAHAEDQAAGGRDAAIGGECKDIVVQVQEAPAGSLILGVGVNSDAGLTGGIILHERNFDVARPPTSQEFRAEPVPGTRLQRYAVAQSASSPSRDAPGERTITLPDGSTVTLTQEVKVRISQVKTDRGNRVRLETETFTIEAARLRMRSHGTVTELEATDGGAFNARTYPVAK
jgi:outer membrane protein assembly factor BamA